MAVRRKQSRSQRVVATPHPQQKQHRGAKPASMRAAGISADPEERILSSSPDLTTPVPATRTRVARSSRTSQPGEPDRDESLEPSAKRRKPSRSPGRAAGALGGGSEDYAAALADTGFQCPTLATNQPAVTIHNNRPNAPTHPPIARKRPLTIEEARKLTTDDPPVRVYADGVFDLFHLGHARLLMQAKQSFANVCVISGIPSDDVVKRLKGNTVCTAEERLAIMQHNRYVDEVIQDAPFTPTLEFLERHKIDFVAHDAKPLSVPGKTDIYAEVKSAGRFLGTQRTEGVSTSGIIARIVRNYDNYVRRNLSRGYPREDLGLNYVSEQGVHARGRVHEMMRTWKGSRRTLIGGFISMVEPVTAPISSLFSTMKTGVSPTSSGSSLAADSNSTASAPSSSSSRRHNKSSSSAAMSSGGSRFDDFLDDDFDEEQEEDMAKPWFKETAEFILSESESGDDPDG
eukprot:scpid57267/ scgid26890/ Choline-phosphate cytidylyltransferase B; CCT-beta; CTP:phosphocholine cytidylyltransferase B; Phosphorylcholine transferase B